MSLGEDRSRPRIIFFISAVGFLERGVRAVLRRMQRLDLRRMR